jgi:hypothetical protein
MGIIKAFKNASRTIDAAKKDVAKKPRDEVKDKRDQKNGGRSK